MTHPMDPSSVDSDTASRHLRGMQAIKFAATIEKNGELHLTNLPVHSDQQVEVIVLISEESHALSVPSPQAGNEHEWQTLVDTIRRSEPHFPTLDDAMNVTRGRS